MKHLLTLSLLFLTTLYAKEKVYVFCNLNYESYHNEKEEYFKLIFEPHYKVKFTEKLEGLKDVAYVITLEVPFDDRNLKALQKYPKEKRLLFSFEGAITNPRSHQHEYGKLYGKVFTWNDDMVDNKKYFKVFFPWGDALPQIQDIPAFEDKKLAVLVGSDNHYNHPIEGYSMRRDLINFFEKKPYCGFEFYGNWKKNQYKNCKGFIPWDKSIERFTYSRRAGKINIIKNYKFDIVYDNCLGCNGYINERLWDSFAAGCVPVYYGTPNITQYIPANCFIPRQLFASNEELLAFLNNMTQETYEEYQQNIRNFLASEQPFCMSSLAIVNSIKKVLNIPE